MRISYAHGASDHPLIGATIGDWFDAMAQQRPAHDALVACHQGVRYSYGELQATANRCAQGLIALGVAPGDRVGVWSPNCAEWVVTLLAVAKIGAILVNFNPGYRQNEIEYVLNHAGCSVLMIAPPYKGSDYAAMVYELAPELRTANAEWRTTRLPALRRVVYLGDEPGPGLMSWQALLALSEGVGEEALRERQRTTQFDQPVNIQYTAASEGQPRGATLSHHNLLNNAHTVGELMRFSPADRLVVPVPLFHSFGLLMGALVCLAHGATIILPDYGFEAGAVLQAVQSERATALHGVPTMFIAELEHPDFERFDLSSLRTGLMAGAPCPIATMQQVNERMHMREVEIAYGMTETSPVSCQTRADAPLEKRVGTVGQPLPHVEIKLTDGQGRIVPRGEVGEICTRGYSVMLGYWNDERATRGIIDAARWLHTGDLGVIDDEGYVKVVGKAKDMLIRGGENIYPREVELFLQTHGAVEEVAVIGVPDLKYGEEVMAWIKLRPGATVTAEEVKDFCRGKIAHFKTPRYCKLVEELPRTPTGAVDKTLLRQQAIQELGLEAAAAVKTA